jgi:aspartate/methionine/tyrosine aminotransferase
MNKHLQSLPIYLSKYISDRVSSDDTIVNLSIGEPFFKPPQKVMDELYKSLALQVQQNIPYRYAESRGSSLLRSEISKRYKRLYNAQVDMESEVLVTHGAAEAIWLCILTATSEGDEVIIADPSYMLYETAVRFLGRVPVKLPTHAEDGFVLDPDSVAKAITSKTKLLIINSPENPTGAVYGKDVLLKLNELAEKNDFYFIHDEVYDSFLFEGTHQNIFRHQSTIGPRSILINSFSKRFSMMGWRLGWIIANKDFLTEATKVHTNLTLNLGILHQDAASTVLNDIAVEDELKQHVKQISANMEVLINALANADGFSLPFGKPKSGFFLFPNISGLYDMMPDKFKAYRTKGEGVMEYMLERYKIAIVPGFIYGQSGNDAIRVVAAVNKEDIAIAASRFAAHSEPVASS